MMDIDYSHPIYLQACKTNRQKKVLMAHIKHGPHPKDTAKALGIDHSNVYKILKRIVDRVGAVDDTAEAYKPKILVFDIETAPLLGYVWGLWENNVGLNQIYSDWYVLSWSAKWLGDDNVMYADQRDAEDIEDDYYTLEGIWNLLDEADIVVTQNGRSFDQKKLNARFILQGFKPPSSYRHLDTKRIAQKHFKFTSNKLEYMTDKLCTKYKKLKHAKFSGFELWKECLKGNIDAWEEMEEYNRYDVLSLEELFFKLAPWDASINLSAYHNDYTHTCMCGSTSHTQVGYYYTNAGKYAKFQCNNCGAESRGKDNYLHKEKRKSMHMPTVK